MSSDFALNLAYFFAFIIIGILGRQFGFIDLTSGRTVLKFIFSIPLPILVFLSFASTKFEAKFLIYPLISAIITLILIGASLLVARLINLPAKRRGAFLAVSSIPSTLLFTLAYVASIYKLEDQKYLFLYDFGDAILIYSLIYILSGIVGSSEKINYKQAFAKVYKNPMMWALILGLAFTIIGLSLPENVINFKTKISGFTTPMLLISIGIFLNFKALLDKKLISISFLAVLIKIGLSFAVGFALLKIFGITGVAYEILLLSALSPTGSISIAFAADHDLDIEFASMTVILSILISIVTYPLVSLVLF